jgi:beta-N-acetylhexosaminidase
MTESDDAVRWVEATIGGMSLERKIAQMITVEISGGYVSEGDPRMLTWSRLVRDLGVGGLVAYGGTPHELARLLNRFQREAAVPLLISADFEAGPGQQIAGASEFPGDMALSAAGSEDLAYRVARISAREGRAMGIHLTYSPVVDVSMRPENPAESVRSFGGDIDLLGRMTRAYVRGYRENGMLTTAKHFPGRGDVAKMPEHPWFTLIDKSAAAVEAQEFRAFRYAIEAGVDFVMTEHVAVPSVTGGSDLPASVEQKLATVWLRERLGFQGILSSDDLWYDAVCARFGAEEVALMAVKAGHDILLKPKDPFAVTARLREAVRGGQIAESRIDESVRRILLCKARLGIHKDRYTDESLVSSVVGIPEHLAVIREVAERSLTLLKNVGVLPIPPARLESLVNISIQKTEADPSPTTLAARLAAAFPGSRSFTFRPDTDSTVHEAALRAATGAGIVTLSLFVQRDRLGDAAPLRARDRELIERIARAKPGAVIAMSYGNPHLLRILDAVPAFVVGYGEKGWFGNQEVYFDAFIRLLKGEMEAHGKLPVHVSADYPIGTGA